MGNNRRNEHLVGVPRKDGTPYKLLPDDILKAMMIDWIKGKEITEICIEYKITRIQFHRQKYHKDRMLADYIREVRLLRDQDLNSKDIGSILGIPYEQVNIIIATML
jgi:hypothetical protein